MATRVGITASGLQEQCTIEHNCPRHAVHAKNSKEAVKLLSSNKNAAVVDSVSSMQNNIPDSSAIGLDAYNMATHECKMPSTAFRDKFTCKECGKIYHSSLTGGEGAQMMWEEYTPEQQKKDAETCRCNLPYGFFKKNGYIWTCPRCKTRFELDDAGGEMGGKIWSELD